MNKQEILNIFNDSVAGFNVGYKSLYECECPQLNRNLGFRAQFQELILDDIKATHSPQKPLVYVCQGPGGFLWDFFMINSLINTGYHSLTIIFIEPLYEKNIAVLQAYLDLQEWYNQLTTVYSPHLILTVHLFKSFKDYEQACTQDTSLKGNFFVSVDPDDQKTIPDFDHKSFRIKFSKMLSKTMHSCASFYYLYFQKVGENPYRSMLLGRWYTKPDESIIAFKHLYGTTASSLTSHNRVFLNNQEVFPFESLQKDANNNIQIGKNMLYSLKLRDLLKNPLS